MTIIITCSQCGHKDWYVLQQSKAQRKTAKQRGLTGYASVVPNATGAQNWQAPAPQAQSGYIAHASRAPSLDDVFVPFLWAAGSGAVVFIGSAVTAYALHAPKPLLCSFVAGWGALAFKWFGGLGFVQKSIWWLEEVTGHNIDSDPEIGEPQPAQAPSYTLNGERRRKAQAASEAQKDKGAFLDFVRIVAARQSDKLPTGSKALRNTALSHQRKVTDPFHKQAGEWLIKNGMAKKSGNSWKLTAELAQIEAAAVYLTPPSPDS